MLWAHSRQPYLFRYRLGFPLSTMTTHYLISPMKFCYNASFTLPKQSQRSRSVSQDRSRFFGLFWKGKKNQSYNQRNTVCTKLLGENDVLGVDCSLLRSLSDHARSIKKILYFWSFHMKFMKLVFGEFHVFHMNDSECKMTL